MKLCGWKAGYGLRETAHEAAGGLRQKTALQSLDSLRDLEGGGGDV